MVVGETHHFRNRPNGCISFHWTIDGSTGFWWQHFWRKANTLEDAPWCRRVVVAREPRLCGQEKWQVRSWCLSHPQHLVPRCPSQWQWCFVTFHNIMLFSVKSSPPKKTVSFNLIHCYPIHPKSADSKSCQVEAISSSCNLPAAMLGHGNQNTMQRTP